MNKACPCSSVTTKPKKVTMKAATKYFIVDLKYSNDRDLMITILERQYLIYNKNLIFSLVAFIPF